MTRFSLALLVLAAVGCTPAGAKVAPGGGGTSPSRARLSGLVGNYGFLTDYSCIDEATARARIDDLVQTFGVTDVQFYDWFVDYSTPTSGQAWTDPWKHERTICLQTIQWYVDELHLLGARAWAYVQSIASEDPNLADATAGIYPLVDASGTPYLMGNRIPTYFANAAWAQHQVSVWAPAVASLGFDGIHWDTLGRIAGDYGAETAGFHAFLGSAGPGLQGLGLLQTMNFVSVSWWDDSMVSLVEFPYAEVWSMSEEQTWYTALAAPALQGSWGVMAFYPSVDTPAGWSQSQVMIARWNEAPQHQARYLVVGDGRKRLVTEYFPDAVDLTEPEVSALTGIPPAGP